MHAPNLRRGYDKKPTKTEALGRKFQKECGARHTLLGIGPAEAMRVKAFIIVGSATIVAAVIGWFVGIAVTPDTAELESAIYPWVGAAIGAGIALLLGIGTVVAARSSRGRDDS